MLRPSKRFKISSALTNPLKVQRIKVFTDEFFGKDDRKSKEKFQDCEEPVLCLVGLESEDKPVVGFWGAEK